MSTNVFEHPFLEGLLGHSEMAQLFSVKEDIAKMVEFEAALAKAQGELSIIPKSAATQIAASVENFTADINALNLATARDGVVVPELVQQLRAHVGEEYGGHVHYCATSQDVIDTSLVLRLKCALDILGADIKSIIETLNAVSTRFGENQIMARTRMQNAKLSSVMHQVANWHSPLEKLKARLPDISANIAMLQLGGPIGNSADFGNQYHQLATRMAELLNLNVPSQNWHTERTSLTSLANWLSELTGCLGKIGQDICLLSINEIADIKLSDTGSSSAMPHKQNPVKPEILVTLARFNATQLPAMHHALVHENNRSGAMWTLEWMILPQMVMATAGALRIANEVLCSVEEFGKHE